MAIDINVDGNSCICITCNFEYYPKVCNNFHCLIMEIVVVKTLKHFSRWQNTKYKFYFFYFYFLIFIVVTIDSCCKCYRLLFTFFGSWSTCKYVKKMQNKNRKVNSYHVNEMFDSTVWLIFFCIFSINFI